MVDWQSPAVITACLQITNKIDLYISGIYTWHFLVTLRCVEIPLLTGKLTWRWVYLYYLGARYILLGIQIPLRQVFTPATFEVLAITGCMVTVFATGNLLFRTYALWSGHRTMQLLLILLGLGHWAAAFVVAILPIVENSGKFSPTTGLPKTIKNDTTIPFFLYSFILDFVVMVLTIYGLFRQRSASSTRLWKSLYKHGVIYYVTTIAVNAPNLILAWTTESACVIGAFTVPGLVVSVMASSRAVTSLLELPGKTDKESTIQERRNMDISAFTGRSERLSTNINLSLPALRTAFESDAASTSPDGSQDDLEGHAERNGPTGRQVSFILHEVRKE